MSVSCFLQGACSPSHSCASPYQPHLCPTHLAWRYHQMSPNVTSLFQLVHSLSLFLFSLPRLMHCWTKCTLLTVTQPPHGPTGSLTHPVVLPMFVQVSVRVWRKNSQVSLFSPPPYFSSPRNEGAPPHSRRWPGWPHRATQGQWRPPLFPGVRGKSSALTLYQTFSLLQAWKCVSLLSGGKFFSLIPYACILIDYGSLLTRTFLSHFYNSITNLTRKATLTLNAVRCLFTKLIGGKLLKQSVCVLMFSWGMLFYRQPRWEIISSLVFFLTKTKANLHLKWHIVRLGTEQGQMKWRGILECRKNKSHLLFICWFVWCVFFN